MTTEYVDLHKEDTVKEAFERIRRIGLKKETVYTCYITDDDRHLLGVTTVKDLLMEDYDTKLIDVMEEIKSKSTYCKVLGNYRAYERKE